MYIKHLEQIPMNSVAAGKDTSMHVLIGPETDPNFAMRRFCIEPGGFIRKHRNAVEHQQLVLAGEAEICMGDEIATVKKGSVVFIPADVPHYYRNTGNETFEFLCIIPNTEDRIEFCDK